MEQLPKKLQSKLNQRKTDNAFRTLGVQNKLIDFSSNDYLGFSKSETIFENTHNYLKTQNILQNGSTGSRLLSGNHVLYEPLERTLSSYHNSESVLLFNSGYDANIGFFASVPQKGDYILYDEYSHASIRDGISLSNAKAYKFKHNNLEDLKRHFDRLSDQNKKFSDLNSNKNSDTELADSHTELAEIYIITESVFSMDGDSPDLVALSKLCKNYNANLIIDEAHALGVFGTGLVQKLGIENSVFARIITFGKALGCHGAAILGSKGLKDYLINFSRSLIYTTALPPHSLATIQMGYNELNFDASGVVNTLQNNIAHFKAELKRLQLQNKFIVSDSAIHCCIVKGNAEIKNIALQLQNKGFHVKPILSPTVPKGQERLRFCLHSYNSEAEITKVLELLVTFVT